jgi:hypothetical protein
MNRYALIVSALLSLAVVPAAMAGAQQEKMKACNQEAKEKQLKGDERKKFMSSCLSNKPAAEEKSAGTSQQEKMKACNKEAGDKQLKGDERKKFMSTCLKG